MIIIYKIIYYKNNMFKKNVWLGFSSVWKNAKDAREYIKWLIAGWANEFFTWYNPPYWHEKFWFEISPNMRFAEHEQITDYNTLKEMTEEIHANWFLIYANLNFWYYTDETFPYIEKMISEFIEIWIDWITCSSIAVLEYLKNINYKWKVNISTIQTVYNTEAVRFFLENYKVNKIILSREVTLKEMEKIINEFPEVQFEFFWEGDFCRYNNWLCFAEHKYSNKDICTVVVNDLVIKKKYKSDFKKVLLDNTLSAETKVNSFDDSYLDLFEQIENIFLSFELGELNKEKTKEGLRKLVDIGKNRVDLYYDALKPINDIRNKNIVIFLKAVKFLESNEYKDLEEELTKSIKSWLEYNVEKTKELLWKHKLKAYELRNFYARNDNLNLYSYMFLLQYPNVDTKFPTRWRSYNERMQIITDVTEKWEVDTKYLDRSMSLDRVHYDLTYLFWDKLRFRNLLKEYY